MHVSNLVCEAIWRVEILCSWTAKANYLFEALVITQHVKDGSKTGMTLLHRNTQVFRGLG